MGLRAMWPVWFRFSALVAALGGCFASGTLLFSYLNGRWIPCGESDGCIKVAYDAWASVGPVPTPAIGLAFFAASVALASAEFVRPRAISSGSILFAGIGVLGSLAWSFRSAFVVRAFCPWCATCLACALVCLAAKLLASSEPKPDLPKTSPGRLVLTCFATFATVAAWAGVSAARETRWSALKVSPAKLSAIGLARLASASAPTIGSQYADRGTLIAFMDFECPACREAYPLFRRCTKNVPLRYVFHCYAVEGHDLGMIAAAAAYAELDRGGFWRVSDLAFSNEINVENISNWLKQGAVPPSRREQILRGFDTEAYKVVADETKLSKASGISATPSFVLFKKDGSIVPLTAKELPYLAQIVETKR